MSGFYCEKWYSRLQSHVWDLYGVHWQRWKVNNIDCHIIYCHFNVALYVWINIKLYSCKCRNHFHFAFVRYYNNFKPYSYLQKAVGFKLSLWWKRRHTLNGISDSFFCELGYAVSRRQSIAISYYAVKTFCNYTRTWCFTMKTMHNIKILTSIYLNALMSIWEKIWGY